MKPGPELDALIHVEVMKMPDENLVYAIPGQAIRYSMQEAVNLCPPYSTAIAAAWLVVEKLIKDGFYPDLISGENPGGFYWNCELHTANDEEHPDNPYQVCGDTAPHAICLAALKAVGVEI